MFTLLIINCQYTLLTLTNIKNLWLQKWLLDKIWVIMKTVGRLLLVVFFLPKHAIALIIFFLTALLRSVHIHFIQTLVGGCLIDNHTTSLVFILEILIILLVFAIVKFVNINYLIKMINLCHIFFKISNTHLYTCKYHKWKRALFDKTKWLIFFIKK